MKAYVAVQRKLLTFMYILWKKEEMYWSSEDQETRDIFSKGTLGTQKQTAESNETAALDGLPLNQKTEALFSVS